MKQITETRAKASGAEQSAHNNYPGRQPRVSALRLRVSEIVRRSLGEGGLKAE